MDREHTIASLLGSRICHDLISPLGAIGNGVELLSLDGSGAGPEISLISESVDSANARIRFFRVAFGAAPPGQQIARKEILAILEGYSASARVEIGWHVPGNPERRAARLAFLLVQCLESALPFGGEIEVEESGGQWCVRGEGEKMKIDHALWSALTAHENPEDLRPADVQFALAPDAAAELGRTLAPEFGDHEVKVRF